MNGFSSRFELDVNREFAGLSDEAALQHEIETLRTNLTATKLQMQVERSCAIRFSVAVSDFFHDNPLLADIVGVNGRDKDHREKPTITDVMGVVFGKKGTEEYELDDTTLATLGRKLGRGLRAELHPDKGGSTELAQEAGALIDQLPLDPAWVISNATLLSNSAPNPNLQDLRNERYELTFALAVADTKFITEHEAEGKMQEKVANLPWQVRVEAALVCLSRICGTPEQLAAFAQKVFDNPRNHANQVQPLTEEWPAINELVRRIASGGPKRLSSNEVQAIDAILAQIWKVHADQAFEPPFLAWLEIIRPVFEILDPTERSILRPVDTMSGRIGEEQGRPKRFFGSRRGNSDEEPPLVDNKKISYIITDRLYSKNPEENNKYYRK